MQRNSSLTRTAWRPILALFAVFAFFAVLGGAGEGGRDFPYFAPQTCAAADWPAPVKLAPAEFGIDLPDGKVTKGKGEVVTTLDDDGQPAVARVYVTIGENALVMLPDGQIVPRKKGKFSPSDRKFEPIEKKALAERLVRDEFPGFKTKLTNHYVYVYDTSEEFALVTSRILESMLPGVLAYGKAQKIAVTNPTMPLVVVMFKTEEEFQKHQRMPRGVVAYYHTLSNRVFMYEQSHLADARPDLAVQQALSTMAHEGAHQILHNIGVQQRLSIWPMWLSEGLAEYYAPTTAGQRLKWKGAGEVNDLRMFELEQYVQSRAADKATGEMIEHTTQAARLTSTGYATAWSLTHFLATKRRAEFNEFVKRMSELGPLEATGDIVDRGIVRENLAAFQAQFGNNLPEIETKLVLHLKKQPYTDPFSANPHFVATLLVSEGRKPVRQVNTFHNPTLAQKWLRDSLDLLPAETRPKAETAVRGFPNRPTAEAWARQWAGGR